MSTGSSVSGVSSYLRVVRRVTRRAVFLQRSVSSRNVCINVCGNQLRRIPLKVRAISAKINS